MLFTENQTTPVADVAAVEQFLACAPDAQPEKTTAKKTKKKLIQISITISEEDLVRIDAWAEEMRVSRAGFIRNAIFKAAPPTANEK